MCAVSDISSCGLSQVVLLQVEAHVGISGALSALSAYEGRLPQVSCQRYQCMWII